MQCNNWLPNHGQQTSKTTVNGLSNRFTLYISVKYTLKMWVPIKCYCIFNNKGTMLYLDKSPKQPVKY